jgi:hypothetical protein
VLLVDMQGAAAGADPPVDLPDLVAGHIRTEFGELHTVAGVASQTVADQPLGAGRQCQGAQRLRPRVDLEGARLAEFSLGHQQAEPVGGAEVDGTNQVAAPAAAAQRQPQHAPLARLQPQQWRGRG